MQSWRHNLSRFTRFGVAPILQVLLEAARHVADLIPRTRSSLDFQRFWGDQVLSRDSHFVIGDYETVPLARAFRGPEAYFAGLNFLDLPSPQVVDGAFAPEASALLASLFARHASARLRVVNDIELGMAQGTTVICYGNSDANFKTFEIEAWSANSLCQLVRSAGGERAFRVGGQIFSMETHGGVTYDKAILLRLLAEDAGASHLICAGLSEWGSLAAVQFLVTRWRQLHHRFDKFGRRREFCLLLDVPLGQYKQARELMSSVHWNAKPSPVPKLWPNPAPHAALVGAKKF